MHTPASAIRMRPMNIIKRLCTYNQMIQGCSTTSVMRFILDNKLEEAADVFQRVINIKPDYADAHNNLGNIYKALNNNELAIKHYEQAVKLNPGLYEVLLNLAHMFADRIGHPEVAESYFRKALAIQPDNIEAMSGVTNMLRFQGKLDDALDMIKQVQAKFKDEPGCYRSRSRHLRTHGRLRRCIQNCAADAG